MFTVRRKYEMEKLQRDIHVKRQEMVHLGLENGLNNLETIRVSQELDKLIVQYQKYKEKKILNWIFVKKMNDFKNDKNRKQNTFWEILVEGFIK